MLRLVCISDTHGDHEGLLLPQGDVLIHAGDFTAHGKRDEVPSFMRWIGSQGFKHVLCIAGNHDTYLEQDPEACQQFANEEGVILLNDSGCEIDGHQFWGSPITPRFCDWAFMRDPGEHIEAHWNLIPQSTDVLITHGPPFGIMDGVERLSGGFEKTGCPSLLEKVQELSPTVHLFGHIHEGRGREELAGTTYLNISTMDKHYRIVHEPVIFDLS